MTAAREDLRPFGRLRAAARRVDAIPLAVAGLTLAAFLLLLSQIHQSLYEDEGFAYSEVVGHGLISMIHTVGTGVEVSPPLFFVLAWFSVKLGDPLVWIRLPSLILGAATIPVIYLLGRETVGRAAGAIGAAAFAVSPFSLFYGVQARPYATAAFFTVLSTYALVRAVRSDERRWWVLYALAAAAYSHYTAVFVLVVQAVWALWACRTRWRRPLTANLAAVVLYLPWLAYLHGGPHLAIYALIESFTARHVLQDVVRFVAGYPYAPLHAIPTVPGFAAIAAAAVLGGLLLARRYLSGRAHAAYDVSRGGLLLIVALALATPAGVLLYSILRTDIWDARNLYASAPAAALVLGGLLAAIPRPARAAAGAGVLAVLAPGTVCAISPSYARPPFRAPARYLDEVAGPRDPVVTYPPFGRVAGDIPVEFEKPHPLVNTPPARWPQHISAAHAYVVMYDARGRAPRVPIPHPRGYALVSRRHYSGLLSFTVFGYRRVS